MPPKARVQMKQMGKGKVQDMAKVFQELFQPNPQNVHIYIQKINDLCKQYKKIAVHLRNMNTNMANGELYNNGRQQLSQEDKNYFKLLKDIKSKLKSEMTANKQTPNINQVSILMYTTFKDWVDLQQLQQLSTYFNGELPGTFTHRVVELAGSLSQTFSKLKECKINDSQALRSLFMGIAIQKEGQLYIENFQLDQYILGCSEDDSTRDHKFSLLYMTISMLLGDMMNLYKALKMPEFDVSQIRDLVEQAIKEFKKSLPGCDLAFQKLLQSLDVFTNDFDSLYETFNANNKEPATLLVGFIQKVEQQYQDVDNAECRKLLRQFKSIQGEFAKRLGSKLDSNPIIKNLYDQLCSQLGNAERLIEDPITNHNNEEIKEL